MNHEPGFTMVMIKIATLCVTIHCCVGVSLAFAQTKVAQEAPTDVAQETPTDVAQQSLSSHRDFDTLEAFARWYETREQGSLNAGRLIRNSTGEIISIRLMNIHATDKNLKHVSAIATLEHLKLHCANKITDGGFRILSDMRSLVHLEIGLVYQQLPSDIWETLSQLRELKRLDLIYLTLPADELHGINRLLSLERLSLTNIKGVTAESCEQLANLSTLRFLAIKGTSLRPGDIASLDRISENMRFTIAFDSKNH